MGACCCFLISTEREDFPCPFQRRGVTIRDSAKQILNVFLKKRLTFLTPPCGCCISLAVFVSDGEIFSCAEKKFNCAGNCKPLQEMNVQKACLYLKQNVGLDYLCENWWTFHTDNPFRAIRDMLEICRQNGGQK